MRYDRATEVSPAARILETDVSICLQHLSNLSASVLRVGSITAGLTYRWRRCNQETAKNEGESQRRSWRDTI